MSDLIARLEAAEGPCRELDAEIAQEVGWTYDSGSKWGWVKPNGFASTSGPDRFTSSIDAAITLVPEGMRRHAQSMEGGRAAVLLQFLGEVLQPTWGRLYANEPIATCIAALKARQTP